MLRNVLFGKSTLTNGFIAVALMSLIVLGCTCNKDMFKSKKTSNSNIEIAPPKETPKKNRDYEKSDASKGKVPSDEELQDIVGQDMLAFDKALKDRDFGDFYDRISKVWQKQTSANELKTSFQPFIDGKASLSGIEDLDASFSPEPKITKSKGVKVLEVEGSYPTKPSDSTFELKYIAEDKDWKLIGFFVKTTIYKKQ